MGNYVSKDGNDDGSNVHDSIPSRNHAGGGGPPVKVFRPEEPSVRPTDEQALALEGDMDSSVRKYVYIYIQNIYIYMYICKYI
jgi:hypothetical protein